MGKINIVSAGGYGSHENTLGEYDNEISDELLDRHLEQIASVYKLNTKNRSCYVFGMGAQSKSTYAELNKETGVKLLWSRSMLTGPLKIFGVFIASHAGLIKVLDSKKLPSVVKKLCHMSMAGVYIFDKSLEQTFVSRVAKYPSRQDFDFGIKGDDNYFFYIVDADNAESSTGIFEIVSYGREATDFANLF